MGRPSRYASYRSTPRSWFSGDRSQAASATLSVEDEGQLPELAGVRWRTRADEGTLSRAGRRWTLATAAQAVPVLGTAGLLMALSPLLIPVALLLLLHGWIVGELYAARGAKVIRGTLPADHAAERVALGLLGDLIDHRARELHAQTGLVAERGRLGIWLLGERGALLVRPGGRRVHCYCVRVPDPELPPSDRIAHLLLALRTDERGFATVANLAFSGARWRVRRRLAAPARRALEVARHRGVSARSGLAEDRDARTLSSGPM